MASGKIATGGEVATHTALDADIVHIGRGLLFSLGCIQALRWHTNICPTGVTTQNPVASVGTQPGRQGVRVLSWIRTRLRRRLRRAGQRPLRPRQASESATYADFPILFRV